MAGFLPHAVVSLFACVAVVIFSMTSMEVVTLDAAEPEDPSRNMRQKVTTVMPRILAICLPKLKLHSGSVEKGSLTLVFWGHLWLSLLLACSIIAVLVSIRLKHAHLPPPVPGRQYRDRRFPTCRWACSVPAAP